MKIAIDSYCYHRYFGEVYAGLQHPANRTMTVWDFLRGAQAARVGGVSLESCFLPADPDFLRRLRDVLDETVSTRVWAWGHPDGLRSGTDRQAARDLVAHLAHARTLGAGVMRIAGGSRRTGQRRLPSAIAARRHAAENPSRGRGPRRRPGDREPHRPDRRRDGGPGPHPGFAVAGGVPGYGQQPAPVRGSGGGGGETGAVRPGHPHQDIGVRRGDPNDFAFWPSVPLGTGLGGPRARCDLLHKARYNGLLAIEVDFLHPDSAATKTGCGGEREVLKGVLAEGEIEAKPKKAAGSKRPRARMGGR